MMHRSGYALPDRGDGLHWLRCVDCGREWAENNRGTFKRGSRVCGCKKEFVVTERLDVMTTSKPSERGLFCEVLLGPIIIQGDAASILFTLREAVDALELTVESQIKAGYLDGEKWLTSLQPEEVE